MVQNSSSRTESKACRSSKNIPLICHMEVNRHCPRRGQEQLDVKGRETATGSTGCGPPVSAASHVKYRQGVESMEQYWVHRRFPYDLREAKMLLRAGTADTIVGRAKHTLKTDPTTLDYHNPHEGQSLGSLCYLGCGSLEFSTLSSSRGTKEGGMVSPRVTTSSRRHPSLSKGLRMSHAVYEIERY